MLFMSGTRRLGEYIIWVFDSGRWVESTFGNDEGALVRQIVSMRQMWPTRPIRLLPASEGPPREPGPTNHDEE